MKDFHDVCLYTDVLVLADVFERFRSVCMKSYDLDPAHYHTAPGLAWDACLKYTKIELRTLNDKDMHMFLERGMRGGISMITHRHAKANNSYLKKINPEDFDTEKTPFHFIYLDANNLYGLGVESTTPRQSFYLESRFREFLGGRYSG